MKTLLRFHARCDHDNGSPRKSLAQHRDNERLSGGMNSVERQSASLLHAVQEVLHGASVRL
jgi:hypothetical protein